MARSNPTLRERAIALLARREHSRAELARKLAHHAESDAEVEALLDELARRKLLSDGRYVSARSEVLARKFGAARVVRELRDKGIAAPALQSLERDLKASELDRARAVWQKRFGAPAGNAADRARQARFLQARGFSFEVIRRVVRGLDDAG
ncbi:MAG: recombination regulator RecX [Burkholderiales bacterium]|nr:recombination regulator RecX [Burkholderiales bacterium]